MKRVIVSIIAVCFASIILVGVKYKFWSDSRFANERGIAGQFSPLGLVYTESFNIIYSPGRTVAQSAFSVLPYGGTAIDLASDLAAVTAQNIACIAIWFGLRRRTRNQSSHLPHG
jgi:hypothetical protein